MNDVCTALVYASEIKQMAWYNYNEACKNNENLEICKEKYEILMDKISKYNAAFKNFINVKRKMKIKSQIFKFI